MQEYITEQNGPIQVIKAKYSELVGPDDVANLHVPGKLLDSYIHLL